VDIESILSSLGLDLTNPEVKRGALEAIDAIIASRQPNMPLGDMGMGGGGQEEDVEIDPDLLQPSIKNKPQGSDDIEINDEDDILKDVKHNDSENTPDSNMDGSENGDSDSSSEDTSSDNSSNSNSESRAEADDFDGEDSSDDVESRKSAEDGLDGADTDQEIDTTGGEEAGEDSAEASSESDNASDDEFDFDDDFEDDIDGDSEDEADVEANTDDNLDGDSWPDEEDSIDNEESDESEENDGIDEDDLLDNELKEPYEDQAEKAKHEARRIKRERTIQAAEKHLADAKAKKKAPALIRELEKAIEALQELQEAAKNIKDISDEEFNLMVNRVFDAIDALGDSELTYTSDEERQLKAKEIKADLEDKKTQAELSAEDIAKLRAETQAIKAREKETAKYQKKSRGSFKGFQDFLNSLYRAIALQVNTEETRDDSWSVINRRYSSTSILQPGKKFDELPNRKIPVIDFYFDQSGSWGEEDIRVGKKAVAALADLEAEGKIKINIYYFANSVSAQEGEWIGSGTSGWNEIIKNIVTTNATNVIIMTDDDMENWWRPQDQPPLRHTVPGYVWYLWRDGLNAPRLPRDLKGRGGVQQFSFSSGDV
jgi:hypothetical protein